MCSSAVETFGELNFHFSSSNLSARGVPTFDFDYLSIAGMRAFKLSHDDINFNLNVSSQNSLLQASVSIGRTISIIVQPCQIHLVHSQPLPM